MYTPSRADEPCVRLFENEWQHRPGVWAGTPLDRDPCPHWSDDTGMVPTSPMDAKLPVRGAQWTTDWLVDTSGPVDVEGWTYGPDFVYLAKCVGQRRPDAKWRSPVRRRVHRRHYTTAVPPRAAAPSPAAAHERRGRRPPPPRRAGAVSAGAGGGVAHSIPAITSLGQASKVLAALNANVKAFGVNAAVVGTRVPKDTAQFRQTVSTSEKAVREQLATAATAIEAARAKAPPRSDEAVGWERTLVQLNAIRETFGQLSVSCRTQMRMSKPVPPSAASAGDGRGGAAGGGRAGAGGTATDVGVHRTRPSRSREADEARRKAQAHFDAVASEVEVQAAIIEERDQEIMELCEGISDLNGMFKDLNMLVAEQRTGIDQIEANVGRAQVRTAKGVEELEKARQYQSKRCVVM